MGDCPTPPQNSGNGKGDEEQEAVTTAEDKPMTPSEKLLRRFVEQEECDVTLIVGKEKKRIGAHKFILATGSPTFQTMFRLKDSNEVEIPDVVVKNFEPFLKYLYAGDCSIQVDDAVPMLSLAKYYKVPDLSILCGKVLETALTENSALTIFQQAVEFNEKALEESSLQFICKNADKILVTPEFLELETEHLCKILPRDDLAVSSESKLFEFVIGWAKEVCKREKMLNTPKYLRSVLEKIIPFIRFPQMKPDEFALVRFNLNILTTEEVQTVWFYRDIPQSKWDSLPKSMFNPNRREYRMPEFKCILKRLTTPSSAIQTTNQWHRVCFRADTFTCLASIGLNDADSIYGYQRYTDSQYKVTVEIKLDGDTTAKLPLATVTQLIQQRNDVIFHVNFTEPVEILADTWYTAALRVEGNYYGTCYTGPTSVDGVGSDGSCVKFEFKNAETMGDDSSVTTSSTGQMAEFGFLMY